MVGNIKIAEAARGSAVTVDKCPARVFLGECFGVFKRFYGRIVWKVGIGYGIPRQGHGTFCRRTVKVADSGESALFARYFCPLGCSIVAGVGIG